MPTSRQTYTEEEIVEGCRKNNRKFQELFYSMYASKMYAVCLSYAKDREDARDILQDGFVKAFDKIKSYKKAGSLEGWLRRIITHTAIDFYRRSVRFNQILEEQQDVYKREVIIDNIFDQVSANDIIQAVNKLPLGSKMVFNLFALEGYTHREIAEKLGISQGTSKSQYSRARNMLQKELVELKR